MSGDLLDIDQERLSVRIAGRPVAVVGLQLKLLLSLARHPNWVRTREQLLHDVWGDRTTRDAKCVDVLVCRLRQRLGTAGTLIESVRGFGYRLATDDDGAAGG